MHRDSLLACLSHELTICKKSAKISTRTGEVAGKMHFVVLAAFLDFSFSAVQQASVLDQLQ
jgi:hypothetical protein